MGKKIGKICLSGEETIIWNVENEDINEFCRSEIFYVPKFSKKLLLFINMKGKSPKLFLCAEKGYHNFVLDTYNLNVVLKYTNKTTQFPVKAEDRGNISDFWYTFEIATLSVDNLSEIIIKMQKSTGTQEDTGPNDNELEDKENVETEENEVKTRGPNNNELEVKESVETEENEAKTRGEAALITSLKNAFLNEEDSDVTIKVGDQNYPAHRVIIRARSSVFDKMLKHDMVEKNKGVIDVPDCDPHIFRDFLHYIYSGKMDNISNENIFELYHMSDKYDVKELRRECVDFLMNNLTINVICDVIFLATRCHEPALLNLATKFFVDNAKEIVLTVKWLKFLKENPIEANELFVKYMNKECTIESTVI